MKNKRKNDLEKQFTSPLGHYMQKFISLGQSQGKIYQQEERILCRFDRFLRSYLDPPRQLSDSIIRQWLALFSKSKPEYLYKNFTVIRRFCLHLRRFDPNVYVPDSSLSPPSPPQTIPYIYSRTEILSLLKSARQLKASVRSPLRPRIFYLLLLLLYTTGMRISEALKLRFGDIDRKNRVLYIRETKFQKSRLLPLSPSMMKELEDYLRVRQRTEAPIRLECPLFQNPCRQGPYSMSIIDVTFRHMLRTLGLKPNRGYIGPCIHSLRHTFAVHRLEDWYRRGEDVQSKLRLLSTYLGHVDIASTQRYLTMTSELLQQASKRFNQYFISIQNSKGELK